MSFLQMRDCSAAEYAIRDQIVIGTPNGSIRKKANWKLETCRALSKRNEI